MGTNITRTAICVFRRSICVFWACHVIKLVLRRGHIISLVAIQARAVANVDATGVWHAVYGTTPADEGLGWWRLGPGRTYRGHCRTVHVQVKRWYAINIAIARKNGP